MAEMLALGIGHVSQWTSRSSDGSGGSAGGDNWPVSTFYNNDVGSPEVLCDVPRTSKHLQ
jgi:hypothetical protein